MGSQAWLDDDRNEPSSLRTRVTEAIDSQTSDMEAVARRLLAQIRTMEPNREAALTLLTADALITLACELEAGGNAA